MSTRARCSECNKYAELKLPKDPPDSVAWECVHCGSVNVHEAVRRVGDSEAGRGHSGQK